MPSRIWIQAVVLLCSLLALAAAGAEIVIGP